MNATETTEQTTWDTAFDAAMRGEMTDWAARHAHALDEMVATFLEKAVPEDGGGWFGTESPFMYALRWRGEDLMKAETDAWVAAFLTELLADEELTAAKVVEMLTKRLQQTMAEGLRTSSTSAMTNTLSRMRGVAAMEWNAFSAPAEQWRWAAYYKALRQLAADEVKQMESARKQLNDAGAKLDRARSENGKLAALAETDQARRLLVAARFELSTKLVDAGAPDEAVNQAVGNAE